MALLLLRRLTQRILMHAHGIQRRALLKAGAAAGVASLLPGCSRNSERGAPAAPTENTGVAAPRKENTGPFDGGALRVDLLHSFDGSTETLTATNLRFERAWSGPGSGLADDIGWGDYRLSLYDANT